MTYNSYNQHWQPDRNGLADAMRRVFDNRGGSYGNERGGYDNRDEQGQYNRQYESPRNGYDSREQGYSPGNTMGFDPEQNRHEYGRPHSAYHNDEREFDHRMDDYFRRLNEGRTRVPDSLCEVVATGVQMYMGNSRSGSDREWQSDDGEETHRRYKAAVEKLREEKDPNAKERLMKELFEDLTPDEMVVLREKAKAKSYRDLAREKWGGNATADRWMEAMKALKHKLKHTA